MSRDTSFRAGPLSQEIPRRAARVRVRRMGLHDLPFVVASHMEHFPHGFFVDLGPRFLARYYRTFLDGGPMAAALVAEIGEERCGYLTGVLAVRQHRSMMLTHHGLGLAVAAGLGMVTRPRVAIRFLLTRARRYATSLRRRSGETSSPTPPGDTPAVLSQVVVVQPDRLAGIGRCLVETFLREARDAGCTFAQLVTEAGDGGAGPFYESLGWRLAGSTSVDGRALLKYEIAIPKDGSQNA